MIKSTTLPLYYPRYSKDPHAAWTKTKTAADAAACRYFISFLVLSP